MASLPAIAQPDAASAKSSWRAETALKPGSPSSCQPARFVYSFQLDGSRLTGTSPGGLLLEAAVAADGTVAIRYSGGAGMATITGNARSKELEVTAENAKGCRYALVPVAGNTAATSATDWALGRWSGRYYMAQYMHRAALNVFRNARSGITCQLQIWEALGSATSDSCKISDDKIKFGSGIYEVELWRKTSNTLLGTHMSPGTTRMQLSFTHD